LQAAFELLDYYPSSDPKYPNMDAFEGFAVEVWDDDGNKYTVKGYERADLPRTGPAPNFANRMDCLYVFLEEKPYSDGNAILHWKIISNDKLKDLATRGILIGEPGDTDTNAIDEESRFTGVWDTVPPRVNYALTVPGSGRNEIYFQMSEPVDVSSPIVASVAGKTVASESPFAQGTEFILGINTPFAVSDLAVSAPPKFTLKSGVHDFAVPAGDLRNSGQIPYAYRFPPPKYPVDYGYTDYVFVQNDNFTGTGSVTIPNIVQVLDHQVTDVLISVPPRTVNDSQYFAWPLWAMYDPSLHPSLSGSLGDYISWNSGYVGPGGWYNDRDIIWDFTGRRFLEASTVKGQEYNVTLQIRKNTAVSSAIDKLVYAFNVRDEYKGLPRTNGTGHGSSGLWLPVPAATTPPYLHPHPLYANIAPLFLPKDPSNGMWRPFTGWVMSSSSLFNYEFSHTDPEYGNKTGIEFYAHLAGTPPDLYVARLEMEAGGPIPSDWYYRVRPFSFGIHNIIRQRNTATILNNVINPTTGERVYLDYDLQKAGRVTIQVFTLDGNLVKVLERGNKQPNKYRVSWDGRNNGGRIVARGMYFIRIVAPDIDEIRKVMVVK
jgi:hypothetical protein